MLLVYACLAGLQTAASSHAIPAVIAHSSAHRSLNSNITQVLQLLTACM